MGKGKPRHDPDKKQNKMGHWCGFCEDIPRSDGTIYWRCELDHDKDASFCKGNPHMCKKVQLRAAARRSDRRKNIDGFY